MEDLDVSGRIIIILKWTLVSDLVGWLVSWLVGWLVS